MKTTNIEIYNFLNLTSHRFGRLYKYTGYSPLPKDFVIDKEKIKEKLFLYQMKNNDIFPSFISEDKKQIKKYFQNSFKNCKKIRKYNFASKNFSENFLEKLEIYFDMRTELTDIALKEFKNHGFDEAEAYREIFNIDPVFGELLDVLFEEKVDFDSLFEDFEEKYTTSYLKKLKKLEKKTAARETKKQAVQESIRFAQEIEKEDEKAKKSGKEAEKIAKNKQKTEKKQENEKTKVERENKEKE